MDRPYLLCLPQMNNKIVSRLLFIICLLFIIQMPLLKAQTFPPLRRPISAQQPMWLIHIDTWNLADPQKIIDMVPTDILPYVVFNISLSINHNGKTGKWLQVEYGYETAKSWLRTCAENRVWAMIQPSSGGFSQFSDTDLTVYKEFFRDYPNFLGFNYAEQFWGFDDKWSVTYPQRLAHWVDLMKLSQEYGGYLSVSFTNAYYDANKNPIAMMRRDPNFAAICKEDPEHLIISEKFTMGSGFSEVESVCEGAYLSGYAGQYGIRFDECGWVGTTSADRKFPVAAGAAPIMEHLLLTGETVIDGPETVPVQCSREIGTKTTAEGYTMRQWQFYPQFYNISMDIFRKVLDGTIRLLSRKEVIDRTKIVLVANIETGDERDIFRTPESLYEGLYRMDGDGTYLRNRTWFKKTGRYPAIPMVYQLSDADAKSFQLKVDKSDFANRWPTVESKVAEFNSLFPQEYSGDLYAAHSENAWITYNPFKTGQTAKASIPFKYNTCDRMELTYAQYTSGIVKEYPNKLTFYLTNYDNLYSRLKTDTIKVFGSSSEPTFSVLDRLIKRAPTDTACTVVSKWSDGVFTLYVKHGGPLDITVNCNGIATDRLTSYKTILPIKPEKPAVYTGPHQYEAENFLYKNIGSLVKNGINSGVHNYTAQGFLKFGTNPLASIVDTVQVLHTGMYTLKVKYAATDGNVRIGMLVGHKNKDVTFQKTDTSTFWAIHTEKVRMNAGRNILAFHSTGSTNNLIFDNIVLESKK
jgi:hypothetical protein